MKHEHERTWLPSGRQSQRWRYLCTRSAAAAAVDALPWQRASVRQH